MAIFATIAGALGRFAGKILTAALGWASTLLFGRVSKDKQMLLVLITFGSVLWFVLVAGVLMPDVGTFLLAFVPLPSFVDENWVRLGMLIAALIVPILIGVATVFIQDADDRPKGFDLVKSVLRGYPLAFVLAFVLVFLGLVGLVRKGRALFKRWSDAHVAIVVQPGGYDRMVGDLEKALDETGLEVEERPAPAILSMPPKLLAAVAGAGVRSLVPDRLAQLNGDNLEIQLYPSDVAISGTEHLVTRARAAIASRLTSTAAYLTTAAESQKLEDILRRVATRGRLDQEAHRDLQMVDDQLKELDIAYEEWEVLYRIRLQVERDLVTGRTPGAVPGEEPGTARPARGAAGGSADGRGTPAPIESIVAAASIALLVLDVVLALRDRGR